MIVIRMELFPPKLKISGHAGYAEPGQDIVCAAVSALYETLRQDPHVRALQDGDQHMIAADPADREMLVPVFAAFGRGFAQLARQYPDYVSYVCSDKQ